MKWSYLWGVPMIAMIALAVFAGEPSLPYPADPETRKAIGAKEMTAAELKKKIDAGEQVLVIEVRDASVYEKEPNPRGHSYSVRRPPGGPEGDPQGPHAGIHVRQRATELAGCEARGGPGISGGLVLSDGKLEGRGVRDGIWEDPVARGGIMVRWPRDTAHLRGTPSQKMLDISQASSRLHSPKRSRMSWPCVSPDRYAFDATSTSTGLMRPCGSPSSSSMVCWVK